MEDLAWLRPSTFQPNKPAKARPVGMEDQLGMDRRWHGLLDDHDHVQSECQTGGELHFFTSMISRSVGIPDATHATGIGLPIDWGGARGVNGSAVLAGSPISRVWV